MSQGSHPMILCVCLPALFSNSNIPLSHRAPLAAQVCLAQMGPLAPLAPL